MTENEWNMGNRPVVMLNYLVRMVHDRGRSNPWHGPALERKLRLFLCATGRRLWSVLTDPRCRTAIEIAEDYADHRAPRNQLLAMQSEAKAVAERLQTGWNQQRTEANYLIWRASLLAVATTDENLTRGVLSDWCIEQIDQAGLLREIVGYPFNRRAFDPVLLSWHQGAIPRLAADIDAHARYHQLTSLADALAQAGCADATMIDHCRRTGGHHKGCWVIDRLLGRE